MNNNSSHLKCDCASCGNHIEFPSEAAGITIDCPHCSAQTLLRSEAPADDGGRLRSAVEIINAFQGALSPARVSFLYQLGLTLVSLMMVLLPVIYLALVCLAAWGVYYFATHFSFLVTSGGGLRLYLLKLMLYLGPLFAGVVLVLFMVKPIFARRPPQSQPLELNPALEPTLFAFIAKICDLVGAPMPKRIDLDCNLNASASFRRGALSFLGNDLILTIGVPLAAGLSMPQLAGVIGHEFGHFTQGFGMRVSYIIRSINFWFARVVYERDAMDVWLEETAAEAEDWRWAIIVGFARLGVWFSRQILKLLMWIGHGVSAFLLRQMEYDADSYEIKLVGSQSFEETFRRMHVLGALLKPAYNDMRVGWNNSRELPDNFPALLMKYDASLSQEKRTQLEDTMGLKSAGIFDTHPSNGDRIRRARQNPEPGVFHLDAPATALFNNFESIARQVSQAHYSEDLGIPAMSAKLVSVHPEQPVPASVPNSTAQPLANAAVPISPGALRIRK